MLKTKKKKKKKKDKKNFKSKKEKNKKKEKKKEGARDIIEHTRTQWIEHTDGRTDGPTEERSRS